MIDLTRRRWAGLTAMAGGLAAVRPFPMPAPTPPANPVDFTGDGIPLTPSQYADLLARLASSGGIVADEYSRGGAVEALEARFAALLGKEAAVFMPSGTLANQLAVRKLAGPRRRVVVQEQSHLYNDTGDCVAQLSQLTLLPLAAGKATFTWEDVERALERTASGRVATEVGVISIESPVRRLHGEAFDFGQMRRVSEEARKRGVALHLDLVHLQPETARVLRRQANPARVQALPEGRRVRHPGRQADLERLTAAVGARLFVAAAWPHSAPP